MSVSANVVTDSHVMTITVIQHGFAQIVLPVDFPTSVEADTPFDITYTVKNNGNVSDTLYGRLLVEGVELTGSYWSEIVDSEATVTKTFTHPGITDDTEITLEVGHV